MSDKIKILHVVTIMNRGGVETMLMNLYRNIDREKIQFDIVVHRKERGAFDEEIRSMGGTIYYAPQFKAYNIISYKRWWRDFFRKHSEYKIIHSHTYSLASIQHKIAKKYGLTTIVHSHNTKNDNNIKGIIQNCLQRHITNISTYLFACSKKAGDWLYGTDCEKRDNFYILNNAIDTKKYVFNEAIRTSVSDELGLKNKFTVGHIGSFTECKNPLYLIDIFNEIHKKEPNSVLLMVGDGPLRKEIESRIAELKLKDGVMLLGVRGDVNELLQVMDCFVFPSLYEGLPVTVVEAQAAGLKCFISDNITDEVCVSELVCRIPISISPEQWADKVLSEKDYERKDMSRIIVDTGYDIRITAQWLTDFYMNLSSEKQIF